MIEYAGVEGVSTTDTKRRITNELLENKHTRIALCERSFKHFFIYYFLNDIRYKGFADFHYERFDAVQDNNKIFAKGMRGIAKTTILGFANIVRRICYNKSKFICTLCYDVQKAKGMNGIIRNELVRNEKIKQDFGEQYTITTKNNTKEVDGFDEKGIGEFVTSNGTKIKAFGMGQTLRGEIHAHKKHGKVRPDFLLVDDIDNNDNTKNKRIIKDDMDFIDVEILGGMEQSGHNIVWLGNVIRIDGRNVRQFDRYKNSPDWKVFDNFLYGLSGKTTGDICWDRYVQLEEEESETKKGRTISIERLKKDWGHGFMQNALGIAIQDGDVLIDKEEIHIMKKSMDNDIDYVVYIGIDPAFSLKTGTDGVGICVTFFATVGGKEMRYVMKAFALYGKDKDEDNIKKVITDLYIEYNVSRVYVENNNGGGIIQRILSKSGLACEAIKTIKDKSTRFIERKGVIQAGQVLFHPTQCTGLLDQMYVFTGQDGGDDDIVDGFMLTVNPLQRKTIIFAEY